MKEYLNESLFDNNFEKTKQPTCTSCITDNCYQLLDKKEIVDPDGFRMDYCLFKDPDFNTYFCCVGEDDPDPEWSDFVCDTEDEASQWFNQYNGDYDNYTECFTEDIYRHKNEAYNECDDIYTEDECIDECDMNECNYTDECIYEECEDCQEPLTDGVEDIQSSQSVLRFKDDRFSDKDDLDECSSEDFDW